MNFHEDLSIYSNFRSSYFVFSENIFKNGDSDVVNVSIITKRFIDIILFKIIY